MTPILKILTNFVCFYPLYYSDCRTVCHFYIWLLSLYLLLVGSSLIVTCDICQMSLLLLCSNPSQGYSTIKLYLSWLTFENFPFETYLRCLSMHVNIFCDICHISVGKKERNFYELGTRGSCGHLSYSEGKDQEVLSLKPVQANSSQDPILKNSITQKSWWRVSTCRPWVQTPVLQKNKYNF
jgi:hypothetical protein